MKLHTIVTNRMIVLKIKYIEFIVDVSQIDNSKYIWLYIVIDSKSKETIQ